MRRGIKALLAEYLLRPDFGLTLAVYPVDGFGASGDNQRRNRVPEALQRHAGWTMAPRDVSITARLATTGSPAAAGARAAALVVSNAFSPPVLTSAGMFYLAACIGGLSAVAWAGFFTAVGVLPPLLYLMRQVQRGRIADLDVTRRRDRAWPLVLTTASLACAGLAMDLGAAPVPMVQLAVLMALHCLALLVITMRWKISVHCATAGATGALLWLLRGSPLPPFVLVTALAWSRLFLRRHTPTQVIAGAVLGCVLILVLGHRLLP